MTENTDPSFEEAVAADWKNAYAIDIERMSPVQKHALQAAWREAEIKNTDKSHDFDRKIARMSNNEFNALVSDVTYDAQRATSKMK